MLPVFFVTFLVREADERVSLHYLRLVPHAPKINDVWDSFHFMAMDVMLNQ